MNRVSSCEQDLLQTQVPTNHGNAQRSIKADGVTVIQAHYSTKSHDAALATRRETFCQLETSKCNRMHIQQHRSTLHLNGPYTSNHSVERNTAKSLHTSPTLSCTAAWSRAPISRLVAEHLRGTYRSTTTPASFSMVAAQKILDVKKWRRPTSNPLKSMSFRKGLIKKTRRGAVGKLT